MLDSCTNFKDYVDRAVELGQPAIAFTEHGKISGWVSKKMYCDKVNIKYLHGVECYLTEQLEPKIRDNYHTVLIAKNYEGVKEINSLITKSFDSDHFYYNNRISFDEFLNISSNVIKTSACLASPLNKLDIKHPKYEELVKHYDYLEIQPHNDPNQISYNVHLASLAQKYNKPLIAGTDTHSLNSYKAECRTMLTIAKDKNYDDDNFDLTYKSREELIEAFRKQDALPENLYMSAIDNTVVMADSVEEFELDVSLKYPILYGSREEDAIVFKETIERKFKDKLDRGIIPKEQEQAFRDAITEECRVFDKIQMSGFMLSMSELISWCRENDIPTGPARGSVGGSRVAYILDIIDLNPETWHTVFSRFANEDRVEVGDVDVDLIDTDRPRMFDYIIDRFGKDKAARVESFGTLQDKAVIDDVGRALKTLWNQKNGLKNDDKTSDNPYNLDRIAEIKKEYELDPEGTKRKHTDIFYYFDGLLNTKISQSVHPAGMVISPITLPDHYGVFDKEGYPCLAMDMEEVHESGLVKYDFLILRNIKVINDTYKMLGQKYPRTHEIDWNDDKVWANMITSPIGIFQMESPFAFDCLRKFRPKSIFDMSLVTACIRPTGASYRDDLLSRKPHKNPSKLIDDLLADNNGYLCYQEDTIKFLQEICGLSGSEADNVRRAIGRKQMDRLQSALPKILEGYCSKSNKPREIAEKEAKEFLQIIEDSASYQFNYSHSVAYCLIGYMCAYLRTYYPLQFITSCLNNAANDDDIISGTELARSIGIRISSPRFGGSGAEYVCDTDNNIIYKGIGSIKFMNNAVSEELLELSKTKSYDRFIDLLRDITENTSLNSRQLEILINIGFFEEFGNVTELTKIVGMFNFFKQGTARSISSENMTESLLDLIGDYVDNRKKDGTPGKRYNVIDIDSILNTVNDYIMGMNCPDIDLKTKIINQQEYLGYVDIKTNKEEDRRKLFIEKVVPLRSKNNNRIWCYAIDTISIGSGKASRLNILPGLYASKPIQRGDIIYADNVVKNNRGYWYLNLYNKIG